jgi:hypothetical protein
MLSVISAAYLECETHRRTQRAPNDERPPRVYMTRENVRTRYDTSHPGTHAQTHARAHAGTRMHKTFSRAHTRTREMN